MQHTGRSFVISSAIFFLLQSPILFAQTASYHLHKEASSSSGLFQLKTAGPDATSLAIQTVALASKAAGEYIIKEFDTQSGDPNSPGVIPTGSSLTFNLWMKKTANFGAMVPRAKLRLNNSAGALLCTATGTTALTTTLTKYTITCTTSANISMLASDRFYLWVGVNLTTTSTSAFAGELDVEGTLNGNFDSQITLPLATGAPTVSSLTPNSGAINSAIVVAGTNFRSSQSGSTIKFNGTTATAPTWTATSITATVPSGATTGPVVVTVGGQASTGVTYTVKPAPSISGLVPNTGAVGASVTINGSNFGSPQGNGLVKFNGTAATVTAWTDTSITVTVPAGATTGSVVVTAPGGVASTGVSFTVVSAPHITSLSPTSGVVGTAVGITGTNFGTSQGNGTVKFNGTNAPVTNWTATSISVPVPTGATTGNVIVHASGVDSNGSNFTVSPHIDSLSPTSGGVGTPVTISGNNFGSSQGASTVKFNGTTAPVTNWGATSILVPVPTGATSGNVVVTVNSAASNGSAFTVTPNITSVSPSSAAIGGTVTINGSNFGSSQGSSTITFNGATPFVSSWIATKIVASPLTGTTTGPVVVTVSGQASNTPTLTIVPAPSIQQISPTSAAVGTNINFTGQNLGIAQGSSTIKINGVTATPTVWGQNLITAPIPSGAPASGNTVLTIAGVTLNACCIAVVPRPNITNLSVTTGSVGTQVTVTGTNFGTFGSSQGGSSITFNGVQAQHTTWTSTSIVTTVPLGAATGPVIVTVGFDASNGITFTVPNSPNIQSLSVTSGLIGAPVTVQGVNFGASQGTSTIKFNNVAATGTWSDTQISTTVPTGATTGPVKVTVGSSISNGINFTVGSNGSLTGNITRTSDGTGIVGATIQALQGTVVKGSATSGAGGSYSIATLLSGTYDLKTSASGFGTALSGGITVAGGAPTTANVTLNTPGSVSGKITQSDGTTAIAGAAVAAYQGSLQAGSASSDASGNYTISGLNPGTYRVEASAANFVTKSNTSVAVTAGASTTTNISLANTGTAPINYVYDDIGRLVAVVDSNGDTAVYQYDAVGNILSISRQSSSQVSVIEMSPAHGLVGTPVTIYGIGFSSTAAQNTVTFNGTSATVISSTSTQINTTVPSGATTGIVSVVTPSGSANSNPFTVDVNSNAPTITSLSASLVNPFDTVTITGTNFDIPANDHVKLNVIKVPGGITGNATSLTLSVPVNATSGHVSVTTLAGQAVSTDDLFVPPSAANFLQIGYTGRINIGDTVNVSLTDKHQALILFDGTAGQKVITSGIPATIYDPTGLLATDGSFGYVLPATGTYTIYIGVQTLPFDFSLTLQSVPADISSTITPGGSPVTVSTVPGQGAKLTFQGSIGQILGLNLSNDTYPTDLGACEISINRPDGTQISFTYCGNSYLTFPPLDQNGTYSIAFGFFLAGVSGSQTLQLTALPITGTTNANGALNTTSVTNPGQAVELTFAGSAGQRVSLSANYLSTSCAQMFILKPDFTTLTSNSICAGFPNSFSDVLVLPVTGNYTLAVVPLFFDVASTNFNLYTVPSDLSLPITIGGSAVPVSLGTPGQNAALNFTAPGGSTATVQFNGSTFSQINVSIAPAGTTSYFASAAIFAGNSTWNLPALSAGNYTITIDPIGAVTGSVSVTLTSP